MVREQNRQHHQNHQNHENNQNQKHVAQFRDWETRMRGILDDQYLLEHQYYMISVTQYSNAKAKFYRKAYRVIRRRWKPIYGSKYALLFTTEPITNNVARQDFQKYQDQIQYLIYNDGGNHNRWVTATLARMVHAQAWHNSMESDFNVNNDDHHGLGDYDDSSATDHNRDADDDNCNNTRNSHDNDNTHHVWRGPLPHLARKTARVHTEKIVESDILDQKRMRTRKRTRPRALSFIEKFKRKLKTIGKVRVRRHSQ